LPAANVDRAAHSASAYETPLSPPRLPDDRRRGLLARLERAVEGSAEVEGIHAEAAEEAGLVMEVTDDKNLSSTDREALRVTPYVWNAKIIKIADQASHLRSLAASPPPG
jgi:hypothetical protein